MVNFQPTFVRTCPRCRGKFFGWPALSRRDNNTGICPSCCQEEAMVDFHNSRGDKISPEIQRREERMKALIDSGVDTR